MTSASVPIKEGDASSPPNSQIPRMPLWCRILDDVIERAGSAKRRAKDDMDEQKAPKWRLYAFAVSPIRAFFYRHFGMF